jgi:Ca-activated chloride channel homolog
MILGFPIWVVFAASAAPVLAAFLYRRRSRVIEVPAVTLWRKVGRPVEFRSIAAWLRSLVALLVQIAIIALLTLALVAAFRRDKPMGRLVLIMDESATMQTREGGASGSTRFDQARDAARQMLQSAPREAKILLIGAAHRPIAQSNIDMSAPDAIRQLDQMQPLDVESNLSSALTAAAIVRDDPTATVAVFSDFASADPAGLRTQWGDAQATLRIVSVGTDQPDAAISSIWNESRKTGWLIGATINSHGMTDRTIAAHLVVADQIVASTNLQLTGETQPIEFKLDLPPETPFEIVLDSGDALAVDDHAFGILPAHRKAVCLIGSPDRALVDAIRAEPSVSLRIVKPEDYRGPEDADVVIVDGKGFTGPMSQDVGWLFIGAPDPDGIVALEDQPVDVPGVTHWTGEHPVLADIQPDLLTIHRAFQIKAPSEGAYRALVSARNTPLIAEAIPAPGRPKCVYWLFDVSQTNLPTRMSFPILLWNTLDYLSSRPSDASATVQTGQPLMLDASVNPTLLDPKHRVIALRRAGEKFSAPDVTAQGIYTITMPQDKREIAVNLLSTAGLSTLHRESAGAHDDQTSARAKLKRPRTWRFWLTMALLLAAVEWALYHRRILRVG